MFLKMSKFKKVINEAYKTCGIRVINTGDGYAIAGGYWYIWLEDATMPNKAKAAIIELTGELPQPGNPFKAQKDTANQYEIEDNEWFWIRQQEKATKTMEPTKVFIWPYYENIYQLIKDPDGHLKMFDAEMMKMVDIYQIDEGEMPPTDPMDWMGGIYWQNDRCSFLLLPAHTENKEHIEFFKSLEQIKLI